VPRRGALAGQTDGVLEALGKRRFARQLGRFLAFDPAAGTLHAVDLDEYRGLELAPGQVAHGPFGDIAEIAEFAAAAGALDFAVAAFATDPQPQFFGLLIDFVLVDAITGPVEDFGELVVCQQLPSLAQGCPPGRTQSKRGCCHILAQSHIYIEKPAAPDVAGCKRVMRAADSADRKLNITFGFQRRYGQVYRKAKEALDSGGIGALRMVHLHFVKSGGGRQRVANETMPTDLESQLKQWYSWRKLSGDLIVENNIHLIDVMNWFAGGHAERAHGWGSRTPGSRGDVRDHNNVSFEYAGGVQGTLYGSTLAPPFYRHVYERFFGESGVIETAAEYWEYQRGENGLRRENSPRNVTADSLAEFVRRIAEGQPENTGVRGAESTLTAIMGRMAMDLKRPVEWREVLDSEA